MGLFKAPAWIDGPSFLQASHDMSTYKAKFPLKTKWVEIGSRPQTSSKQGKGDFSVWKKIVTHLSAACYGHMVGVIRVPTELASTNGL